MTTKQTGIPEGLEALNRRVARELGTLLEDPSYARRAEEVAGVVRSEDGVGTACDAIEELFPRAGAFPGIEGLQGKDPRWQDRYDPTLGGLVEVTR